MRMGYCLRRLRDFYFGITHLFKLEELKQFLCLGNKLFGMSLGLYWCLVEREGKKKKPEKGKKEKRLRV